MQNPSDPSKQSPESTQTRREKSPSAGPRIWIAAAAGVVCVLAAGAWLAFPQLMKILENGDTTKLTSNLSAARSPQREEPPEQNDFEDQDAHPEYAGPSSAYIEEGADSTVLQFGFGSENTDSA